MIDFAIDHEALIEQQVALTLDDMFVGFSERGIDPLKRLHDADFTEILWEYEHSRVGPEIPGSLHPKQVVAYSTDRTHRLLFWGNQVGKTTLGAVECAEVALKRHQFIKPKGGAVIWASALTWEMWEHILLPELLTWIPKDRIVDAPEPFKSSPGRRTIMVRADDGTISRIIGKSAQAGRASYQSAKVHFAWIDEEHPEAIWDELMLRLVRFGGRTLTTATPLLGLTWLYHRLYLGWQRGTLPDVWCSHAGLKDNPSITPEQIAAVERQFAGNPSQLAARMHGLFARPTGLALSSFDPNKNLETFLQADALKANQPNRTGKGWRHICGLDFSYWRFAFVHGMIDYTGRLHVVKEYFSQKEDLEKRARWMHAHLTAWGAPPETRIWGDCADPTSINELNKELKRTDSPYRVRGVKAESKARQTSVTLLNNLCARGALLISRDVAVDGHIWYRGQDAASDGHATAGSRLLYEIGQWRYEKPKSDEQVQADDPVDATADGADCIAALRYLAMSHYRPAKKNAVPKKPKNPNFDDGYEQMAQKVRERMKRGTVAA